MTATAHVSPDGQLRLWAGRTATAVGRGGYYRVLETQHTEDGARRRLIEALSSPGPGFPSAIDVVGWSDNRTAVIADRAGPGTVAFGRWYHLRTIHAVSGLTETIYGGIVVSLAPSPDGERLAWVAIPNDAPRRVHVLDLVDLSQRVASVPVGQAGATVGGTIWSPTGDALIVRSVDDWLGADHQETLLRFDLAEGTVTSLFEALPGYLSIVAWDDNIRLEVEEHRNGRIVHSVHLDPESGAVTVHATATPAPTVPPAYPAKTNP